MAPVDVGVVCIVCDRLPCMCTAKVRGMSANPNVWYALCGYAPQPSVRYEVRGGKGYVGCSVCKAWNMSGNPLKGRQSLGRYMLREDNPNNHAKDTVDRHVQNPAGDHQRAFGRSPRGQRGDTKSR